MPDDDEHNDIAAGSSFPMPDCGVLAVTIDGNTILVGRQFRTQAVVTFGTSLTRRSNLFASLYSLSATSEVSA
jgi:hypothetical protein